MTDERLLPDAHDAGQVRRWFLPINEVAGVRSREPEFFTVVARFLGMGTSHTTQHSDHARPHADRPATRFVARGERCNACRWFEARIFRELVLPDGVTELDDPRVVDSTLGDYVIHNAGMSVVDGEVPLYRYELVRSAYMVLESMTTRRVTDGGPQVFLAKPSAHALASAASLDDELRDVYENRAVL